MARGAEGESLHGGPLLDKMYVAHDLEAISRCTLQRLPSTECSLE